MSDDRLGIPQKKAVIVENELSWTIDMEEMDWENGAVLGLPEGVQVDIVNSDPNVGRRDMFVKFPPGYIEPEHSHIAAHSVIIIDGRMLVHGHELSVGDYVYGQKELHGPMKYPDGCIVFASFVGGSTEHEWEENPNE